MAQRMLGSVGESEEVVQEAWIRLQHAGTAEIETLGAWLTTVVSRICIDRLRSAARQSKLVDALEIDGAVAANAIEPTPEEAALLSDAVGVALLVVLDQLRPAERVAFVMHDLFAIDFSSVAQVLECSPAAARQMASRARRAVRGVEPRQAEGDRVRKQALVEAFFTASRGGDLAALLAILDPKVVLRIDADVAGTKDQQIVRGAATVAQRARLGAIHQQDASIEFLYDEPVILVRTSTGKHMVMRFAMQADRIIGILVRTEMPKFALD